MYETNSLCLILTFSLLLCGCSSFQSEKRNCLARQNKQRPRKKALGTLSTPQSDSQGKLMLGQDNASREIFSDEAKSFQRKSISSLCLPSEPLLLRMSLSPYASKYRPASTTLGLNTGVYWDENGEPTCLRSFPSVPFKLWMVKPSSGVLHQSTRRTDPFSDCRQHH